VAGARGQTEETVKVAFQGISQTRFSSISLHHRGRCRTGTKNAVFTSLLSALLIHCQSNVFMKYEPNYAGLERRIEFAKDSLKNCSTMARASAP
jgi:hypothetical protein